MVKNSLTIIRRRASLLLLLLLIAAVTDVVTGQRLTSGPRPSFTTAFPVVSPATSVPTVAPFVLPTVTTAPTSAPFALPTATAPPTVAPFVLPTATAPPTVAPFVLPTTTAPSVSPAPTGIPSDAPVLTTPAPATPAPTSQAPVGTEVFEKFDKVSIRFKNVRKMDSPSIVQFEQLTEQWYEGFFQKYGSTTRRRSLQATTTTTTGDIRNMDTRITVLGQDATEMTNVVTFSQSLSYTALEGALNPADYLILPYLNSEENRAFATMLANQIPAFRDVEAPIDRPVLIPMESDNTDDKFPIGLVIGVVVAAIALLIASLFVYRKMRARDSGSIQQYGQTPVPTAIAQDVTPISVQGIPEDRTQGEPGLPRFKDQVQDRRQQDPPHQEDNLPTVDLRQTPPASQHPMPGVHRQSNRAMQDGADGGRRERIEHPPGFLPAAAAVLPKFKDQVEP